MQRWEGTPIHTGDHTSLKLEWYEGPERVIPDDSGRNTNPSTPRHQKWHKRYQLGVRNDWATAVFNASCYRTSPCASIRLWENDSFMPNWTVFSPMAASSPEREQAREEQEAGGWFGNQQE
jgi:hypothetical protein